MSFRVHWQDFANLRPGDPKPAKHHRDFPTREEADAFRRTLGGEDLIATVTPIAVRQRINSTPMDSTGLPRVSGGMRLTR